MTSRPEPPVLITSAKKNDPLQEMFHGGSSGAGNPADGFKSPPPRLNLGTATAPVPSSFGSLPPPVAPLNGPSAAVAVPGPSAAMPNIAEVTAFNRSEMAAQIRQSFDNLVKASPIGTPLMARRFSAPTAPAYPFSSLHSPAPGAAANQAQLRPLPPPPSIAPGGFTFAPRPQPALQVTPRSAGASLFAQQQQQQQWRSTPTFGNITSAAAAPAAAIPAAHAVPSRDNTSNPEATATAGSDRTAATASAQQLQRPQDDATPSTSTVPSLLRNETQSRQGNAPRSAIPAEKPYRTSNQQKSGNSGGNRAKREVAALLGTTPHRTTPVSGTMPVHGGGSASALEEDRAVEVSRYGRARVKPLAYWSSERLVVGYKGAEGAQGIHKGSANGDLLMNTGSPAMRTRKRPPSAAGGGSAGGEKRKKGSGSGGKKKEKDEEMEMEKKDNGTKDNITSAGIGPGFGLASLAAAAGAQAAAAAAAAKTAAVAEAPVPQPAVAAAEKEEAERPKKKSKEKPTATRTQPETEQPTPKQAPRPASAPAGSIPNPLPNIPNVSEETIAKLAAIPASERPKRCGQCSTCLNPSRKAACLTIRALGGNPVIPRGKNRIKLENNNNAEKPEKRKKTRNAPAEPSPVPPPEAVAAAPAEGGPAGTVRKVTPEIPDSAKQSEKATEKKKRPLQQGRRGQVKRKGSEQPLEGARAGSVDDENVRRSTRQRSASVQPSSENGGGAPKAAKTDSTAAAGGMPPPANRTEGARNADTAATAAPVPMDPGIWTAEQVAALHRAWLEVPPNAKNFWQKVASMVPGRTANECFNKMYDKHPTPPAKKPGVAAERTAGGGGSRRLLAAAAAAVKDNDEKGNASGKPPAKARGGSAKQAAQNAARKIARQQRRQQRVEEVTAAGAGDKEAVVEALEEQQQRDRYIDQILRKRRGRALGVAPHRARKPLLTGGLTGGRPGATDVAREVTAALAAVRDEPDKDSGDESDYYWSDAE